MKINDQNKILDTRYQKEIKAKEDRIKEMNDAYNKKIQQVKESSEDEITENRNLERAKISQELEQEKEKWEDVRKKWKAKNAAIESENLMEEIGLQQELNTNRLRYGDIMEKEQAKLNQDISSLRERGDKSLRQVQDNSTSKIYQEEIKSRSNIESIKKENEYAENMAKKSYSEQEREHTARLRNIKEENARQLNEKEKVNQENLKRVDETNKNKLLMAEKDFKGRIEQMQKESEQTIGNISSKAQKEINKLKESESKDKNLIKEKTKDPFYSMTNLNPRLINNEKEYLLRLSVPEHEKESVIVGGDGRNLKITQTRRFSDESKNENGTVNKSSRSESISQSIKLDDIINPRKITQSYKDNELTFKIPKS